MTTSQQAHRAPAGGPDASASRRWRVHPAKADPGLAFRGAATILLLALATAIAAQSIFWGLFAAGLLFIVTHRFFLPSEFRIDEEGVSARFPFRDTTFAWGHIRFFEHGSRAANFSKRTRRRFADRLKELHVLLPVDPDERREVVEMIRHFLPDGVASSAEADRASATQDAQHERHPARSVASAPAVTGSEGVA